MKIEKVFQVVMKKFQSTNFAIKMSWSPKLDREFFRQRLIFF
jgi:hypothetical protein